MSPERSLEHSWVIYRENDTFIAHQDPGDEEYFFIWHRELGDDPIPYSEEIPEVRHSGYEKFLRETIEEIHKSNQIIRRRLKNIRNKKNL